MITHELKRFSLKKPYLKLLLDVMDFLNGLKQKSIFIFDQFKIKYIEDGFMEKIKMAKRIKNI